MHKSSKTTTTKFASIGTALAMTVATLVPVGADAMPTRTAPSAAISSRVMASRGVSPDLPLSQAQLREALKFYGAGEQEIGSGILVDAVSATSVGDTHVLSRTLSRGLRRWRTANRKLVKSEPRAWVPIMALFSDVTVIFLSREEPTLARAVAGEIDRMAQRYIEDAQSDPDESQVAAKISSAMLTHVALHMRDSGSLRLSLPVIRRALEIDPSNGPAHHILVTMLEKKGEYDSTLEALDGWLEAEPHHHEARLRRAVMLARLGKVNEALAALSEATKRSPSWMANLAWQETIRLLISQDRSDQAEAAIDQALKQFPDNERLLLLRASLTDDPVQSASWVADLVSRPWSGSYTARTVYNDWPSYAARQTRKQLNLDINTRLGALRQVLGPS